MDERLERIGRLLAVARGLEREGAYNAAKLVRAVLGRETVRYAEAEAPSGPVAVGDALDALVGDLADELPPEVGPWLLALGDAVRAGHTITLRDAPRAHVCRVCGRLFLGDDVPLSCPSCEAPALSFREELPVWYLEPADRGQILAALAAGPRHVTAAIADRSDEELARPPAPGEWSARETLAHLLHSEELLALRVERLLAEEEPELVAAAVWTWTPPSDEATTETDAPASALATRIHDLRRASVDRLAALPDAAWGRAGTHPEWGRVTVLSQAAYFARHEASHLSQLAAAAAGRLPGRTAARR